LAIPSLAPLPSTLAQSLALVWGEAFRRPGILLAVTTVPTLLGWLAVAALRAALISIGWWENGTINSGTWLDLPPGQWLMNVLAHSGLAVAYALAAVLVIPHRIGPRTRPVAPREALGLVGYRWPLLVGWWLLIGLYSVLILSGASAFSWRAPPGGDASFDIMALLAFAVMSVLLALALPLLPVALLEDLPLWNREATIRVWELSSGRRLAEFGCFLLAVGLLVLPTAAAARVAELPTGTVDGIAVGMVTQGLVLGSVAPFAVLTVLAPLLLPGGDSLRVARELSSAQADEGRHVVAGALAVIVLVALPLAGAHLMRTTLTDIPQVSTTAREAPEELEPLSDGSGFAMLSVGSRRGTDADASADADADADTDSGQNSDATPLVLSTCGPDCDEGDTRAWEIGALPEDSRFVAAAVSPVDEDLLAVVGHVRGGLGSTPDEQGYPLVLDVYRCTGSEPTCDGPWTAEPGDPLHVRAREPYPGSETLDLYSYDLELAADTGGTFTVLVQAGGWPQGIGDPDYGGRLVTCSARECGEASVRELPEVANGRLALGLDGSPVIAHPDSDTAAVGLLVCDDPTCADHETHYVSSASAALSTSSDSRPVPSVAVGPSGAPQVVVADGEGTRLLYHACVDASCSSWETRTLLAPRWGVDSGHHPRLVLDGDGRPSVFLGDLVIRCGTPYCGTGS
jgi:hypothetical protein